jgi:hypothetical protein
LPSAVPPTNTPTASATFTPSSTNTATATATSTASPTTTQTPSETLVRAPFTNTVPESSVTPGPNASLTITALDTQLSPSYGPVAPSHNFNAGFNRIYYFVTFDGMQNGVLWRRQLIEDNVAVEEDAYLWGLSQSGSTYFFFGQDSGFKAGSYEIRLYIGQASQPVTVAAFTVK